MSRDNPTSETLTKDKILMLLASRLSCSKENLSFIFDPRAQDDSLQNDLIIPDAREVLRSGSYAKR